MPGLAFETTAPGRFRLSGELVFATVSGALEQSQALFTGHDPVDIDLAGVTATDSAGLALLVEWAAWARRERCKLRLRNLPTQAAALARISEVDKILPSA
jgi:phospholipid transport system transporter-binding protein